MGRTEWGASPASDRAHRGTRSGQRGGCPAPTSAGSRAMHEFQVIASYAVIAAIYIGLFLAAERFFMQDK